MKTNERLAQAVSRLQGTAYVEADLLPQILDLNKSMKDSFTVKLERLHKNGPVMETVYDAYGVRVQEIVVPARMLRTKDREVITARQ